MKKTNLLTLTFLFVIGVCSAQQTNANKFLELPLTNIKPEGWLKTMLVNQEKGLTGNLDTIGFPFMQDGWGDNPFMRKFGKTTVAWWVPYEQQAYLYDGMIRAGFLLKSDLLIKKAQKAIYGAIAKSSPEGIIGSELLVGDRRRWPHAVFFRAMMAAYDNTGDKKILSAMEKHFTNDTIPLTGRDMANVEIMTWLYEKTGKQSYVDMIKKTLDPNTPRPISLFKEDVLPHFSSDERDEIHGVTYLELLKVPVLLYQVTGDKKYLDEARHGFAKLDKFHMLPDGVPSAEEGLSGKSSHNSHETCDVIDYLWSCQYMLKATGETSFADRMERALFNAGLGSITKNFDAHQYYSCPNQVYCDAHSSHVSSYETSRFAYRQLHNPPCCTGNVNRMFPVYIGAQWMKGENGTLVKALYGPGSVVHQVGSSKITLREESVYPYTESIIISVVEGSAEFPLQLRIPAWAENATVSLNGIIKLGVKAGSFFEMKEKFKKGDKIEVTLPAKARFKQWTNDAMVVEYGSMLFALPVKALKERVMVSIPSHNKPFMGYTMNPISDWNYILGVDGKDLSLLKVVHTGKIDSENPWLQEPQSLKINVPAYKDDKWKENYRKITENGKISYVPMTPSLINRGEMIFVLRRLEPETISLVPFGSTELRMSMFPYWSEKTISPEALATE